MQLQTLEIKGFKSFGDKVTIHFDAGVTGIVGPNGCGKSNIVDAIRWALGEQKTRNLRSDKMENVIFNGTRNRKPQQMAEVTLTFLNNKGVLPTEYTSVAITRRYYRSGESEYLLNGVTCRLKDIHQLFMDTGIGSDSYAIIELKMVDDILNDRDNARRTLFEEAAGVGKFKSRKKETLRKLEDTAQDMSRLDDLLFEISKNMRSLEKQAKQAEQYVTLKASYQELSVQLAKATLFEKGEAQRRLKQQIETMQQQREELLNQQQTKQNDLQAMRDGLSQQTKLQLSRQQTLQTHLDTLRSFESDFKIKNERLKNLSDRHRNLKIALDQDTHNQTKLAETLAKLEADITEKTAATTTYQAQLVEAQAALDGHKAAQAEIAAQVQKQSADLKTAQNSFYEQRRSVEGAKVQLQALERQKENNLQDTAKQSADLDDFGQKLLQIEADIQAKNSQINEWQEEEAANQTAIEQLNANKEALRETIAGLNRDIDSKQNEYNLIKSLVESLEGFPDAIKFLKKNAGEWSQNAVLLSDIITTDESYRVAIESYLEPYMNYYVVENEVQAMKAIGLLGQSAKGRANFFILSQLQQFKAAAKQKIAGCTYAPDLLEFDALYQPLVSFLLDGVYVCDTQELPDAPVGCTLLAKEGNLVKRKFSFGGGSVGIFEGKRLGRAKNMEKLANQLTQLKDKLMAEKTTLNQIEGELTDRKLRERKKEIEKATQERNRLNQDLASITAKREQLSAMLSVAGLKQEDIDKQISQIQQQLAEAGPALAQTQQELEALEAETLTLSQAAQAGNEKLAQLSGSFNQFNTQLLQHQNQVSILNQELGFKRNEQQALQNRIERNTAEAAEIEVEILGLQEATDGNDQQLVELYAEKEAIESGLKEVDAELSQVRAAQDQAERSIGMLGKEREALEQRLVRFNEEMADTRVALTAVKERMLVEFEIELEDSAIADFDPAESPTLEFLTAQVTDLRNKIQRLGPVNAMAMENYQEIAERHQFLTQQRQDLLDSKEKLLDTIMEIETVAREQFMTVFDAVRENFLRVFRSLFTEEDTCDLILVDPEHPLESAIDIVARPKGKRPLTINQLSGGEKTLTAISLLFSVYLIKPAPFCIFDEVDAPLDDANIDKFNNIIRKFSDDSQFIIVTHNKRTMASTDVMYGITMLEAGVSRAIAVDLRELV